MSHSVAEYTQLLRNLLPPGQAFPREPGTNLEQLLTGMAVEFARAEARADALAIDVNPLDTLELLPDWERAAGLPDKCSGELEATVQGRRAALIAKLTARGGQSKQYFIDVAASLGYTITITEFKPFQVGRSVAGDALTNGPWRFAWRVNAPQTTAVRFRVGQSVVGEALQAWGNSALECKLTELSPAHTIPIFGYGG